VPSGKAIGEGRHSKAEKKKEKRTDQMSITAKKKIRGKREEGGEKEGGEGDKRD